MWFYSTQVNLPLHRSHSSLSIFADVQVQTMMIRGKKAINVFWLSRKSEKKKAKYIEFTNNMYHEFYEVVQLSPEHIKCRVCNSSGCGNEMKQLAQIIITIPGKQYAFY